MSPLALAPEEITARFREGLGNSVVSTSTAFGMATVVVDAGSWLDALGFARDDDAMACDFFSWLSGIEWVDESGGDTDADPDADAGADEAPAEVDEAEYRAPESPVFELVARVTSTTHHHGVTLKARLDPDRPTVATSTGVYEGADWHERELMEMFGVVVSGHPNPVKLYLPDHFEGHPLRRSFKLGARDVKPWPGDVNVEDMPEDTPVTEPKPGQA